MKWYLLLILGVCCISTSAILVTLSGVEPTVSAFYRNFFAALIWLLLLRCRVRVHHVFGQQESCLALRPQCLSWCVQRLGVAGLFVFLGLFFASDLWAWHRAIIWLGAGPATLVGNLQVVFVALLALFVLHQRLPRLYWPGTVLALLGIGLLTLSDGVGDQVVAGLVAGIFTALTYSFFLLLLKFLGEYQLRPTLILFWVAVVTSLFLLLPLFGEGASLSLSSRSLAILLLHSFVSSVLGWWLIVTAMARLPVTVASSLLLLQPLLTNIWGHLFLNQQLGMIQVVGICVALLGIRLAN